jgi:hypothetical protein
MVENRIAAPEKPSLLFQSILAFEEVSPPGKTVSGWTTVHHLPLLLRREELAGDVLYRIAASEEVVSRYSGRSTWTTVHRLPLPLRREELTGNVLDRTAASEEAAGRCNGRSNWNAC